MDVMQIWLINTRKTMPDIEVKHLNIRVRGGQQLSRQLLWNRFGKQLLKQISINCQLQGIRGTNRIDRIKINSAPLKGAANSDHWQQPLINRVANQVTQQLSKQSRGE